MVQVLHLLMEPPRMEVAEATTQHHQLLQVVIVKPPHMVLLHQRLQLLQLLREVVTIPLRLIQVVAPQPQLS